MLTPRKTMKVKLTFTTEMLGTKPGDPEIYANYIASKAPDAQSLEEEVASLGAEEVTEAKMTIFSRNSNGQPILWDYMIKGFSRSLQSL